MWILSCLQTMIRFDSWQGNNASRLVVFGRDDAGSKSGGLLAKFMRCYKSKSVELKINFHQLKRDAVCHLKEIERIKKFIAREVNAENNGINFALKVKAEDGQKHEFLWPIGSNYNKGTEYVYFKELNGGVFPTSTNEWIDMLQVNVIPLFITGFTGPKKVKDDNGNEFEDYSISSIKKMM